MSIAGIKTHRSMDNKRDVFGRFLRFERFFLDRNAFLLYNENNFSEGIREYTYDKNHSQDDP